MSGETNFGPSDPPAKGGGGGPTLLTLTTFFAGLPASGSIVGVVYVPMDMQMNEAGAGPSGLAVQTDSVDAAEFSILRATTAGLYETIGSCTLGAGSYVTNFTLFTNPTALSATDELILQMTTNAPLLANVGITLIGTVVA